jgi:hypothetical protein
MFKPRFRTGSALKFSTLALLAAALLLIPATLHADTVTYTLAPTDTLVTDGATITGSFTLNSVTGKANGTFTVDGKTFVCNPCTPSSPDGNVLWEGIEPLGPGGSYLSIGWSKLPASANPTVFISSVSYCVGCISTLEYFTQGDFATVPEPSSALLLISGLAVLPFVRRRRAKV